MVVQVEYLLQIHIILRNGVVKGAEASWKMAVGHLPASETNFKFIWFMKTTHSEIEPGPRLSVFSDLPI